MQILVVSTFPPTKCGVGTYAAEQVARLVEAGNSVTKVAMAVDSSADRIYNFRTIQGLFQWLIFCARASFDEVYVHYADNFYFPYSKKKTPAGPLRHFLQALALYIVGKRSKTGGHLVFHEFMGRGSLTTKLRLVRSFAFRGFSNLDFHTTTNIDDFLQSYPNIQNNRTHIIGHSQNMTKRFRGTKDDARRALYLPLDKKVFLCLGFITPSKGFERAVEAFQQAALPDAEIHVVGSLQSEHPHLVEYAENLRAQAEQTLGVYLHAGFLTDEAFDQWLCAADLLILPYRSIVSSGVGARASLYGAPLAVSNLPSLVQQFPTASVFASPEELADQLREICKI
jgi:glycosyltransferase involved in cell wall biosynthesis